MWLELFLLFHLKWLRCRPNRDYQLNLQFRLSLLYQATGMGLRRQDHLQ